MVYILNLCGYRVMLFDIRVPYEELICDEEKQSAPSLHDKTISPSDKGSRVNA